MDLDTRMKLFEKQMAGGRCMPLLPILARIDGKSFHTWTRDLERPYDRRLRDLFIATTKFLVEETQARVGYTQSDEISLMWYSDDIESQVFFDGKIHKMVSVLASMTTGFFNREVANCKDELVVYRPHCAKVGIPAPLPSPLTTKNRSLAFFDCRVWQVPTLEEAANAFVWRELDATRNSIQMAAQAVYSHKELLNKNNSEMQEMLHAKGVNWNDYPDWAKRGTYVQRKKCVRLLTPEERERIPEQYRPAADAQVERSDTFVLSLPPITRISNRARVLFWGDEPVLKEIE
jgi:tRNA(His) 5'-end guanylyltransferase